MADEDNTTAPRALVERYHQQENARWEAHMQLHRALDERHGEIEVALEAAKGETKVINQRLESGVTTFREQALELKKIASLIQWPAWRVFTYVGSALGIVATVVWFAAQTPRRSEVEKVQLQLQQLQIELAEARVRQTQINEKLDRVLIAPAIRP